MTVHQRKLEKAEKLYDAFSMQHINKMAKNTRVSYEAHLDRIRMNYPTLAHWTTERIQKEHDGLSATPVKANRYLATFNVLNVWLSKRGHVRPQIAASVTRYKEVPSQHYLPKSSLRALGEALGASTCQQSAKDAIICLLLTGCRVNELIGADEQGDFEAPWSRVV